ncbi:Extracellular ligand-binding receptor [Denitrovibrio acetiphilus DSM 12809]|uniref:Extracellular ligand-binding receptor n=1 Tax=Denitrovibrio acetiphilus (strain DSM 12809 / NBRC 114555 / N2460) TaxID=522772 RepID=D4H625_DENA2|nr:branched-chain amino acid ABC transporter substrate-binding protein [Denitrovibrio acetiphilus]ADD67671.1 Extracellular ligand-binding receptor [Denitrovibrio acetiphilus DSM 12809]
MRKILSVIALSAVMTVASVANAETIKIGVAGAHSGDLASYGIPSAKAAEIYANEVNAAGGLLGKQIELIKADDVCKPEIAVNSAHKLVTDKVIFVLGHICSGATKAALGTYTEAGIPVMSPSATNPGLTKSGDYPNFFRTIAPDDAQAKLAVDFTIDKLSAKKIAVIHDKGDYGKGFAEFAKMFIEDGKKAEVVLFEGVTPGAVDYTAVVQKIKRSKADAVIFGGYHPEASKIITAMKKKKVKAAFVSDDGVKDDTFIKVAGEYAEGGYATGPKDNSMNPLNKQAIANHKAAYNEDPGAFYIEAYSAMVAITEAIKAAGSTDYDKVTAALRSNWVDTPIGKIKFDERGDAIGAGFAVYQVQNGQYVEVK